MRILNYGSLNVDEVLTVPHFVRPGETLSVAERNCFPGGKGLNQSVALARAGADVTHLGAIGTDGKFLADLLRDNGADVSAIRTTDGATGRAIIQVDRNGQNSILLLAGANADFNAEQIEKALDRFSAGDWLLTQNETANPAFIITEAKKRGLSVALNPSPFDDSILSLPLSLVDLFFVNEIEGAALSGETEPERIASTLLSRYPHARVVLTLGEHGALYADERDRFHVPARRVPTADTTAAGDTFTGYFLASLLSGDPPRACMERATAAAALTVSRPGAAPSIPRKEEIV